MPLFSNFQSLRRRKSARGIIEKRLSGRAWACCSLKAYPQYVLMPMPSFAPISASCTVRLPFQFGAVSGKVTLQTTESVGTVDQIGFIYVMFVLQNTCRKVTVLLVYAPEKHLMVCSTKSCHHIASGSKYHWSWQL